VGKHYDLIDRTGKMVIAPQFQMTLGFSEGLALVINDDGSAGFILD
jgi:hypothetical protein